MNAGLDRKSFVGAVAPGITFTNIDAQDILINEFGFETLALGKAQIHAGEVVGKDLGFVATGGGADFDGGGGEGKIGCCTSLSGGGFGGRF